MLTILRDVAVFDAYVWLLTDPVTVAGATPLAGTPCMAEFPARIKAVGHEPRVTTAAGMPSCPLVAHVLKRAACSDPAVASPGL